MHVAAALFWSGLAWLAALVWLLATEGPVGVFVLMTPLIVSGCVVVLLASGELASVSRRRFGRR